MPPRPTLPADDLYARLEIAVDASPEVIELAWRSLLRQHHPDVAGPDGLERSKRINVAHDWLGDPDLRARYDHERGVRRSVRDTGGRDPRHAARPARHVHPRPVDPAETLARFLDRVAALEPDEIDRLACAEPAPIAFGATIARFLPAGGGGRARCDGGGDQCCGSIQRRPPALACVTPSSRTGRSSCSARSSTSCSASRSGRGRASGSREAGMRPSVSHVTARTATRSERSSRGSPSWTHRASRRSPGPPSGPASTSGGSTIRGRRAHHPRTTRRSGSRRSSPPGMPRPRSRTA